MDVVVSGSVSGDYYVSSDYADDVAGAGAVSKCGVSGVCV